MKWKYCKLINFFRVTWMVTATGKSVLCQYWSYISSSERLIPSYFNNKQKEMRIKTEKNVMKSFNNFWWEFSSEFFVWKIKWNSVKMWHFLFASQASTLFFGFFVMSPEVALVQTKVWSHDPLSVLINPLKLYSSDTTKAIN